MKKTIKLTFNIRETAEQLVPDALGRSSYLIASGLIIVMILAIGGLLSRLPTRIPLYYSLPWGEIRLAHKATLFLLPGLGMGVVGINIAIAKMVSKLSPLLPKVLSVGSAVITGMLALGLWGILQSITL